MDILGQLQIASNRSTESKSVAGTIHGKITERVLTTMNVADDLTDSSEQSLENIQQLSHLVRKVRSIVDIVTRASLNVTLSASERINGIEVFVFDLSSSTTRLFRPEFTRPTR